MFSWKRFFVRSLIFGGLGINLVGCSGQTSFLKNIGLSVSEENQTQYVNLSAKVDLGNAMFDSVLVPVMDPRTHLEIGQVKLGASSDGKTLITLSINTESVLSADPVLGSQLPNGRPVPSALGAAQGELLAIPILQNSRVYIGGDFKDHIIAGVAIAVKGLDSVMGSIGASSNLFFVRQFGEVKGLAGVYGSAVPGQSGVAVFANYKIASVKALAISSVDPAVSSVEKQVSQGINDDGKERVYRYFYGKKRRLHAH